MKTVYYIAEPDIAGTRTTRYAPPYETEDMAKQALAVMEKDPGFEIALIIEEAKPESEIRELLINQFFWHVINPQSDLEQKQLASEAIRFYLNDPRCQHFVDTIMAQLPNIMPEMKA